MTRAEAYAIARSLWRHLLRGYDWNTARLTFPRAATVYAECLRVLAQ